MRRLLLLLLVTLPLTAADTICFSCHSGADGPVIEPRHSHPSGIAYAPTGRLRESRLQPKPIAAPLLVAGNVECLSCHIDHDQQTENAFRLRAAKLETLCLTCHEL